MAISNGKNTSSLYYNGPLTIPGISSCDSLVDNPGIANIYWLTGILSRARSRRQFYLCVSVIALFAEYRTAYRLRTLNGIWSFEFTYFK